MARNGDAAFEIDRLNESLSRLAAQLQPKQLYRAVKNGLRSAARKGARVVAKQVRASAINADRSRLAKNARGYAYRNLRGALVTIYGGNQYSGKSGQYNTRHKGPGGAERWKPILSWAASGTKPRATRKGQNRGAMPNYHISAEPARPIMEREYGAAVEKRIKEAVEKFVIK